MSKTIRFLFRRFGGWLSAVLILLACQLPARAQVTITSASLSQLQQALSFNSLTSTQVVMCAFNGTINLTGPLIISGNIVLEAATNFNVTIQGAHGQRIFQVQPNVNFIVLNLILSGGDSAGTNGANGLNAINGGSKGVAGTDGTGSGNGFGGAIYNLGTNIDLNCIFLTNTASGGNGGNGGAGAEGSFGNAGNGGNGGNGGTAFGGAIFNRGTLTVSNCTFAGNGVVGGNGGIGGTNSAGFNGFPGSGGGGGTAAGAGIYNVGKANIQSCTFDFNFCQGGTSQTAGGTPGGNGNGPAGFSGAPGEGGGIYNTATNGVVNNTTVVNCTFGGNLAIGGNGGNGGQASVNGVYAGAGGNGGNAIGAGLYNDTGGIIAITNCTFASGSVFGGTNGAVGSVGSAMGVSTGTMGQELGGNIANNGTTFLLKNSILVYSTNGGNISGVITDQGYNLTDDATPSPQASTTITNVDPSTVLVLPLSSNGGPTLTFNLQPGSPAIDAIPGTPGVNFPVLDQRGFPRPIGPLADIGAVEFGTPSFSISGIITPTAATTNLTNIVITAAGTGLTFQTMPNAAGFYSFPSLPPDTYTVTPQPTNGFSFSPVNLTVTLAVTNETSTTNNFSATPTFMLGGIISNLTSTATIILFQTNSGNNTQFAQTTTASTGVYTFTNVPNGNYLIVPQQTSTTGFTPLSQTVMNLLADNTNVNFSAGAPTYQVVGQIVNTGGAPVTVKANSTVSFTAITDVNGNYSLNLVSGTYTVTPQPTNGLTSFTPISQFVTVPPSTNLVAFMAQGTSGSFTLSGQVSNLRVPITMTAASGGNSHTTSTDANGNYSFASLPSATYIVTPATVSGASYAPQSQSIPLLANTNIQTFVTTASNYSISGQVTLGTNSPKAYQNIYVIATGTNVFNTTRSYSVQSDSSGNYSLANLPAASYSVAPQPSAFFNPGSHSLSLPGDIATGINFNLPDTNSVWLMLTNSGNNSSANIFFAKWVPNFSYRIQASTNLQNWQDIFTNSPGTNSTTNTVSMGILPNRFFRAAHP